MKATLLRWSRSHSVFCREISKHRPEPVQWGADSFRKYEVAPRLGIHAVRRRLFTKIAAYLKLSEGDR
jgi:hypothetical protein